MIQAKFINYITIIYCLLFITKGYCQIPTSTIKCINSHGITQDKLTYQDGSQWYYFSSVSENGMYSNKDDNRAFLQGVLYNGQFKYCNVDGIVIAKGNYKEGVKHGEQILYGDFLRDKITMLSINNYNLGELNDTSFLYSRKDIGTPLLVRGKSIYANGKLLESINYKNGKIVKHIIYEKGVKKKETAYHSNGNIKSVLDYEICNGRKCLHGSSLVYFEDGKLDYGMMKTFFNGDVLGDTYYEENHQIKVEVLQLDEGKFQINKYYSNGKIKSTQKGEGWRNTFSGVVEVYSAESVLLRKQTISSGTITACEGNCK